MATPDAIAWRQAPKGISAFSKEWKEMLYLRRIQKRVEPAVQSPAIKAATSALLYLVLCGAWIIVSGWFAARWTASSEQILAVEATKGVAFIAVTALLFFLFSFTRWKRIQDQERLILEHEKALIGSEQRNAAAMYSATLAHDLGNLLFGVQGLVENLREREEGDEFLTAMRHGLEDSIQGMTSLARRISSTASAVVPETIVEVDLGETIERLSTFAKNHPDIKRTKLRVVGASSTKPQLNPVLLEEAVLNLLVNAAQATGPGGEIEIQLKESHNETWLEVHDDGPGVPAGEEAKIFDPCVTSKIDGTGLGLLSVRALANSCGGDIRVDRSSLGGACFSLRIPHQPVQSLAPKSVGTRAQPRERRVNQRAYG